MTAPATLKAGATPAAASPGARTLYDKLWDEHVVHTEEDGTAVLYIDRHLVHEVTSPQAFEGLRLAGRKVWRTSSIVATADHNTPTTGWERGYDGIEDPTSKQQVRTLDANIAAFGAAAYFPFLDRRQGIVHVIGPENGATLPGMTVVCGDSHTSTHGAFGALAHGIGTSEVEHVMATQTLLARKAKNMLVKVDGRLGAGVTAKDVVLAIIGRIGTAGGTGYTIEFAGSAIRSLSMEGRMTVCNMAIEAGARAGLVAVDDKTIEYVRGRPFAPSGVTQQTRRLRPSIARKRRDRARAFDLSRYLACPLERIEIRTQRQDACEFVKRPLGFVHEIWISNVGGCEFLAIVLISPLITRDGEGLVTAREINDAEDGRRNEDNNG